MIISAQSTLTVTMSEGRCSETSECYVIKIFPRRIISRSLVRGPRLNKVSASRVLLSFGNRFHSHRSSGSWCVYLLENCNLKLILTTSVISETGSFRTSGSTFSDFLSSSQYVPRVSDPRWCLARPKNSRN